jgi:hypothetical protein
MHVNNRFARNILQTTTCSLQLVGPLIFLHRVSPFVFFKKNLCKHGQILVILKQLLLKKQITNYILHSFLDNISGQIKIWHRSVAQPWQDIAVIDAFSINICNQGSWCMNQLHKFIEL